MNTLPKAHTNEILRRSLSKKVYEEVLSEDGKNFVKLLDEALDIGLSFRQLNEILDLFNTKNQFILNEKSKEFDLEIPNFPSVSSLKTHVVPVYTNSPVILIPHNLGTLDYTVFVQGRYVSDPPLTRQLNVPTDVSIDNGYNPITLTTLSSIVVFVPGVYVGGVYVSATFTPVTVWQQNHSYTVGDLVVHNNVLYLCLSTHVSSDTGSSNYDTDFYSDRLLHVWWKISQMTLINNPSQHYVDNVLFVYHHNYLEGKRRIAYFRKELNSWKFTRKGLELYIRYLLDNNCDVVIDEKLTITRLFKFYNYNSIDGTDNLSEIGILKFKPPLSSTTPYDGRPLSDDDPLIFSPVSVFNPINIYIRADVQPDIKRFVEKTVKEKLIPLTTWLGSQVNFFWGDYTQDWI